MQASATPQGKLQQRRDTVLQYQIFFVVIKDSDCHTFTKVAKSKTATSVSLSKYRCHIVCLLREVVITLVCGSVMTEI